MDASVRRYRYVGPPDLTALVRPDNEGRSIGSAADVDAWISARGPREACEPFTFVVDVAGVLRLAPRRSEHVVCAGGREVLSAGEIAFRSDAGRWVADEISNQSTGYCPDPGSWPAVADALTRAGIAHPGGFTHEVVFRRCSSCGQLHIVRDRHYVCAVCDEALPHAWNVDGARLPRPGEDFRDFHDFRDFRASPGPGPHDT
ncbi:hypothetical protein [Embleya sp. NPDC059237]|uniref:hypothetical protein n=1 Tax=Embleya sp. NPDC059237 TaxID=3346784 RepID=UPI00367F98EC